MHRRGVQVLDARLGRGSALLRGCALATTQAVLSPSDPVPPRGTLAALPPVCGG